MIRLEDLPAGRRRIADGTSGLPLDKVNRYRASWSMEPLTELPPGVVVRETNKASERPKQKRRPAPPEAGPGTELKKAFQAKGVPSCQSCADLAKKMDAWGVAGCRERLDEIVEDMLPRAKKWIAENHRFINRLLPDALSEKLARPRLRQYVLDAIAAAEANSVTWEYGVTTVDERRETLLPRTLESLKAAGFGSPRLFVDGATAEQYAGFGLEVTARQAKVGAFANWVLALWEMYAMNPTADRYAIFQDDIDMYRNLRGYLDRCKFPERGYWNLYSFLENERRIADRRGWVESSQAGRGALGLVFSRDAVVEVLSNVDYIVRWPQNEAKGDRVIDGQVVKALRREGWTEYVHAPTLVDHAGHGASSIGNLVHPPAKSFRGEDFDAMTFLE